MTNQKPFDPLAFTTAEPPKHGSDKRFRVDLDAMYPAVVAAIAAGAQCSTPDKGKYGGLIRRAGRDQQALADALAECGQVEVEQDQEVIVGGTPLADGSIAGGKRETRPVKVTLPQLPCEALPPERLIARAFVLEAARKWFTNELHHACACTLEIYLPNVPRWKLGVPGDVLEELERRL
jgi:hypothetical protein